MPLLLCQPIRNHRARIFEGLADIGYNASKHLWFYGFKVHMLVTLSGYILNYVVTLASVHDIRAVDDLLENCRQPYILADLGFLVETLKTIWFKKDIIFGLLYDKTWKGLNNITIGN